MSNRIDRRSLLTHGACVAAGTALGWLGLRSWPELSSSRALAQVPGETPEERVRKLKLELPPPPTLKGATLVPAVRVGDMLYVSGHGPGSIGNKPIVGQLGTNINVKQGNDAARRVGLTILSVIRAEMGSLDKVVRLVKTLGMVNSAPTFTQQPQVINGFSDLMVAVFGEKAGKGARSAVGMVALPGGIPVEIEAIFQVKA
jgi:enamine deaminase RidA (YjgF/YER057c/UK114 family)